MSYDISNIYLKYSSLINIVNWFKTSTMFLYIDTR